METTAAAATRQYVLYLHNSLRPCTSGFTDPNCGTHLLAFNGYSPVISAGSAYQENLTLSRGPAGDLVRDLGMSLPASL